MITSEGKHFSFIFFYSPSQFIIFFFKFKLTHTHQCLEVKKMKEENKKNSKVELIFHDHKTN